MIARSQPKMYLNVIDLDARIMSDKFIFSSHKLRGVGSTFQPNILQSLK
jgi:hypothetical protein